ncbi:endonuclease domain-containing protein [Bacteroidota bacterium]
MSFEDKKDVLVALLRDKKDQKYLFEENWYRIPVKTKITPIIVKEDKVKLIAFYLPKKFDEWAFTIRWFAEVDKIDIVKRSDIIKSKGNDTKSDEKYYKISIKKIHKKEKPIISQRHRRILFFTTDESHLNQAREINDLFYEGPLEEKVWEEFKKLNIEAERQFFIDLKPKNYILDFALFCKARKIAVECDGDTYHMENENVEKDKQRDNILFLNGWETMRFTSKNINYNLDDSVMMVKEAINKYGGLEDLEDPKNFRYIKDIKDSQSRLFDV